MTKNRKIARLLAMLLTLTLVLGVLPVLAQTGYNGQEVANLSAANGYSLSVSGTALTLTVPYAQAQSVNVASAMSAQAKAFVSVNGAKYSVELTSNGFSRSSNVNIGSSASISVGYKLTNVNNPADTHTGTTAYTLFVGKSSSFISVKKAIPVQSGGGVKSVSVSAEDFGSDKANGNPCVYIELTAGTTPAYLTLRSGGGAYSVGSGTKSTGLTFSVNEANLASLVCDTDTVYSAKAYDINNNLIGEGQLLVSVKSPAATPLTASVNAGDTYTLRIADYTGMVCSSISAATVSFKNIPSASEGTLTVGGTVAAQGTKYPLGAVVFRATSSYKGTFVLTYNCYDTAGYYFTSTITITVESFTATPVVKKTVISSDLLPVSKPVTVEAAAIKEACTSKDFNMTQVSFVSIPSAGILASIGSSPIAQGTVWSDFTKDLVLTPTKTGTYSLTYTATDGLVIYSGVITLLVTDGQLDNTHMYVIYKQDQSENRHSIGAVAESVIDKALEAMSETTTGKITLSLLPYSIEGTLSSTYGTFYKSAVATAPAGAYETYSANSFRGMYYVPTAEIGTAELTYTIYDATNTHCVTGKIKFENRGQSLISYTVGVNNKVFFAPEDFDSATAEALGAGYTLNSVRFAGSDTGNGELFYQASGAQAAAISPSEDYSRAMLEAIYFEPHKDYIGSDNTVMFIGKAYSGSNPSSPVTFTGTVSIAVLEQVDIIYQTSLGQGLPFLESDFAGFNSGHSTQTFRSVTIDALPASGTLYQSYNTSSGTGIRAVTGAHYYSSKLSDLSQNDVLLSSLYYLPGEGEYNTTLTIPFTVYSESAQKSGVLQIRVTKGKVTTLSGSAYCTGALMSQTALDNICKAATGLNLSYITFKLPKPESGKLFYNYKGATSYDSKVTSTSKYYVSSAEQSAPLISKVAFIPAAGYSGNMAIDYTGYDTEGNWYLGTININILSKTSSSVFSDVAGTYKWAADSVDFLYSNDVTKGLSSTAFGPASNIKRGDFMLMLYRAFGLSRYDSYATSVTNFADVSSTAYYANAIRAGRYLGISKGDGTNFSPESSITREEAIALIYRTLEKVGWTLSGTGGANYSSFKDSSKVSSYAAEYMQYFVKAGVVIGKDGYLNPRQAITRAEMAVILHRVLTY